MAKVVGVVALGYLTIFLLILQRASTEVYRREQYDVYSSLPDVGAHSTLVKLREKRDTPSDLKNQYQSLPQNATGGDADRQQQTTAGGMATVSPSAGQGPAVVVPFSDRPLLGVNGTGQRKDMMMSSEGSGRKLNQPKKVLTAASATPAAPEESLEEQLIDNIDVPDNKTVDAVKNHNFTLNETTDYHSYYNSTIYKSKEESQRVWDSIKGINHSSMLSQSHRRAMTVELTFDFPFYGHPVRNITVATGGFLYTGEYVHSWLAATQYIAPLMANFDTSLTTDSFVRLQDNGTAFIVIWENVTLQDRPDVGKFTFSTILHKNGDIVFNYYNIPINIHSIRDDNHPVKVGLSDAYIIDKIVYFARRKTIYEYHRVNLADTDITNSTVIRLTALPTCHSFTDCVACINHDTSFDCVWCPILNRCSTGTDRKKHEWLSRGCERAQITTTDACPAIGQKGNNAAGANQSGGGDGSSANNNSTRPFINNNNNNDNPATDTDHLHPLHPSGSDEHDHDHDGPMITPTNVKPVSAESKASMASAGGGGSGGGGPNEPKNMGVALGVLVPLCLVITIVMWVFYAYRNPHTKSGQLLIQTKNLKQYRPSQWSWRRGEARYTAATIHM